MLNSRKASSELLAIRHEHDAQWLCDVHNDTINGIVRSLSSPTTTHADRLKLLTLLRDLEEDKAAVYAISDPLGARELQLEGNDAIRLLRHVIAAEQARVTTTRREPLASSGGGLLWPELELHCGLELDKIAQNNNFGVLAHWYHRLAHHIVRCEIAGDGAEILVIISGTYERAARSRGTLNSRYTDFGTVGHQ